MLRARTAAEVDAYMQGYRAATRDVQERGLHVALAHIALMDDTTPPPPPSTRTSRPGGRQVSYARGVRVLAGWLYDNGHARSEAAAARIAARVLRTALPAKQRAPRKRPALKEVA